MGFRYGGEDEDEDGEAELENFMDEIDDGISLDEGEDEEWETDDVASID